MLKKTDLLNGKIVPTIFSYAIPVFIGQLVQTLFNAADQVVLGQMAGTVAVASVGACSTIVYLMVNFFTGLASGNTVVLSHAMGEGDLEKIARIIRTAVTASVLLGLLASAIAIPAAAPLLRVTNCPAECYEGARTYLYIYFASIPAIMLYSFAGNILRVSGDSRRPTVYLILSGLLNVVLNVILCLVLSNKLVAVAIATVASQMLGAFLTVRRLTKLEEDYRLDLRRLGLDWHIFGKIMRYGVPTGVSQALVHFANLQVQSGINSYGPSATAGCSAVSHLNSITASVLVGFCQTAAAMVGQNLGAKNYKRVRKSMRYTLLYGLLTITVLSWLVILFRRSLIGIFVPGDEAAIEYGIGRMYCTTAFEFINFIGCFFTSVLNVFGYSIYVMFGNVLSTLALRIFWMQVIYPAYPAYQTIMWCFTASWIASFLFAGVFFIIVYSRFRKGIVRKI